VNEHEERRLKGVFRVVPIAQNSPTHAQYHCPVPMHDGSKRSPIPPFHEELE
jgi:hypothetical protein